MPMPFRQHDHLEREVGNGEADGLRPLQRVGGRRDADVGRARGQRRDAIRERRLDISGFTPSAAARSLQVSTS